MRARLPPVRAGLPRWRSGLLALAVLLAAVSLPAFSGSGSEPAYEPDVAGLVLASLARRQTDPGSERPLYLPEPGPALSTASPPQAVSGATLVSKVARWGRLNLTYRLADTELPFRYHVDEALARRFGLETVVEAMAQWDDIPGSRWATSFGSIVNHSGAGPRNDGHPVVYLRSDCPQGYLGTARWNTDPERMHLDHRYGTGALYGTQVDIAVCDEVETEKQLRGLLAHEVGHVLGMAHLCEPGEVCWPTAASSEDHSGEDLRCRPMYSLWGPCRGGISERDREAARHLYPTLGRLHGPSRIETAARASYATTWTHTAETVILTRADEGVPEAVLAAALSGALDAPLLLGVPSPARCIEGPAASELARAGSDGATVLLLGAWPSVCEESLGRWNLAVERLAVPAEPAGSRPARLSAAAADLLAARGGEGAEAAFLVTVDEHGQLGLDGASAATEAGRRGVPLLFSDPGSLSRATARWIGRQPDLRHVWVVGPAGPQLLADLARLRPSVVRTSGSEPVERAAFLAASHAPAPAHGEHPVVIGPIDSVSDALVAAAVAGRLDAPLLLSPPEPHPVVEAWLARYPPHGGYVVGGLAALPYAAQRAYARLVSPPREPVPSRDQAPGWQLDLPRLLP